MKFGFVIWVSNQSVQILSKALSDKLMQEKNSPLKTIGFIADEKPDYILIVQSFTDDEYFGAIKIARSSIKELKILGEMNVE